MEFRESAGLRRGTNHNIIHFILGIVLRAFGGGSAPFRPPSHPYSPFPFHLVERQGTAYNPNYIPYALGNDRERRNFPKYCRAAESCT